MGREIKRVALDFAWPLGKVWGGYINPYWHQSIKCPYCGETHLNPESREIERSFYDFEQTGSRWCDKITQDEADALVGDGRIRDLTHTWTRERGWQPIDPPPTVTAAQINATQRRGGLDSHDAIDRWILVRTRCERLGVWGHCPHCDEDGRLWPSSEIKKQYEGWEELEPPSGDGWQVWETVSEGSPITPVFATPEDLVEHLVVRGTSWGQRYSREAAEAFVKSGWVPSMIVGSGKIHPDIESALLLESSTAAPKEE